MSWPDWSYHQLLRVLVVVRIVLQGCASPAQELQPNCRTAASGLLPMESQEAAYLRLVGQAKCLPEWGSPWHALCVLLATCTAIGCQSKAAISIFARAGRSLSSSIIIAAMGSHTVAAAVKPVSMLCGLYQHAANSRQTALNTAMLDRKPCSCDPAAVHHSRGQGKQRPANNFTQPITLCIPTHVSSLIHLSSQLKQGSGAQNPPPCRKQAYMVRRKGLVHTLSRCTS